MSDEEAAGYWRRAMNCLKAADRDMSAGDYENCCSRSYYATLNALKAAARLRNARTTSHRGARTALGQLFIKTEELEKTVSRDFAIVQERRQTAEYGVPTKEQTITKNEAADQRQRAGRFVDDVRELLKRNGVPMDEWGKRN